MRTTDFQLDQFEYLTASATTGLLRIAARWPGAPDRCALVATTRDGEVTLDPLPQPPAAPAGEVWRAAYPAPLDLVRRDDARFALLTPTGARMPLPRPPERSPVSTAPEDGLLARGRAAWRGARADHALRKEHARALEGERAARERAELAAERAAEERARLLSWMETNAAERARLEQALSEARERTENALAPFRAERLELERALAESRAAESASSHAADELRGELNRVRSELDEVRALAESRLVGLRAVERRLARFVRDVAAREAERVELERALAESRSAESASSRALEETREALARARADVEEARATAESRMVGLRAAERRLARVRARVDAEVAARTRAAREEAAIAASEREEAAALRERVALLEGLVERLRSGVEDGDRRLADAEERAETLRAAVNRAAHLVASAPTVEALRAGLDRRLARLADLEKQAEALRAAIYERAGMAPAPEQDPLFEAQLA